jgi:hypothetical protein
MNFRYYKTGLVISFIVTFGALISFALTQLYELIPFIQNNGVLEFPSTIAIISGSFWLINKKLWFRWPFKYLLWIPDIRGRYIGKIQYKNPKTNEIENKDCAIEIIQNGNKLKVNSYFQTNGDKTKTNSQSIKEWIIKNEDDTFSILFNYQNEGNQSIGFTQHYGTNILKVINNGNKTSLQGFYYTNREPQTKGEIEVQFISEQLKYNI